MGMVVVERMAQRASWRRLETEPMHTGQTEQHVQVARGRSQSAILKGQEVQCGYSRMRWEAVREDIRDVTGDRWICPGRA